MEKAQQFVSAPAGAYAVLRNYNGVGGHGNYGGSSLGSPYVPPTTVEGVYIVPSYSPITYDALTHGHAPSYAGYFSISDGYGSGASNCDTKYLQRLCNGPLPTPVMPTRRPTMMPRM